MGPGRYRRVRYLHGPCGVSPPNSRRYDAGAAHDVHSRPPGICLEGCPPPRAPSVAALRACSQRRVSLESGVGLCRNTGAPMGVLHPRVLPPATSSPRDWVLAMSIFVPLHLHLAHRPHRTAPHHHHATPGRTLLPVTHVPDTPHTKPGAAPDGVIEARRLRATTNASFSRHGRRWSPPATPPTVGPRRCCAPRLARPPTGFHGRLTAPWGHERMMASLRVCLATADAAKGLCASGGPRGRRALRPCGLGGSRRRGPKAWNHHLDLVTGTRSLLGLDRGWD